MTNPSEPGPGDRRNRLADEVSPYLLQHADNPVDWHPWGDEALALARRQERPIFLSIGYATCHWCHVMAHESFEDPQVAELLNRTFVNVKVDREERPDIDAVYMTVCQLLTGSGGWPLTVMLTPELRPFFAATYLPRESRFGRPGMLDLIPRVADLWRDERSRLLESADQISDHLASLAARDASGRLPADAPAAACRGLVARFDPEHGGFGDAPKFPTPFNLEFLLECWRSNGDAQLLEIVETTLRRMRAGGIFDQLGFGFHRYSTDPEWLVPHFEKMLYDQALHLRAAAAAWHATRREEYATTAREVAAYVLRDLTSPDGGFYSAEDADSEGVEGKFYVWTLQELQELLGPEDATVAARAWNLEPDGNFRDEASGERTGANILHRTPPPRAPSDQPAAPDEARLETIRQRLLAARQGRVRPLLDDKVLADWNGLMVAALAAAGRLLGDAGLVSAAAAAFDFVDSRLRDADGHLLHRWRSGRAAVPAFLDDHAFLAWGALELYDATLGPRWLERALSLTDAAVERFWDAEGAGFFQAPADQADLLVRTKDATDGAVPSANGVLAQVMVGLARLTGRPEYERRAVATVDAFAADVARLPSAHVALLAAAARAARPSVEVVIAATADTVATGRLVAAARESAPADAGLVLIPPGDAGDAVRALAPFTASYGPVDGLPAAYVCRNHRCNLPTTDADQVREQVGA